MNPMTEIVVGHSVIVLLMDAVILKKKKDCPFCWSLPLKNPWDPTGVVHAEAWFIDVF